ncbi:MAG: ion channel activity [Tremellales sp. Tagirdzhanova-0007]|nr:MAG: ion channel activity [Tremellales sp. Tagirdzhanova-0007]
MDFLGNFKPTTTTTLSVDPPGGTGTPSNPHHTGHPHHSHLPLPTMSLPSPTPVYLEATDVGRSTLWVVFVIFTLGLLGVGIMALRVEKRARIFHWCSAGVLTIAMVSYLVMSTGLGISYVSIHDHTVEAATNHLFREVYYARYIDWLFTTPLLLLSLAFLAGLSPADTVLVISADVFMIVTGLMSTLVPARSTDGERSRWLWYGISCAFFLGIWFILLTGGRQAAALRPKKTRGLFNLLGGMTLLLWTAYPIVFGLTEGANILSVDVEIVAYAVLDVAAKVGFTFLLLIIHSHGDEDTWTLPDWFVEPRHGQGEGGRYGAIRVEE